MPLGTPAAHRFFLTTKNPGSRCRDLRGIQWKLGSRTQNQVCLANSFTRHCLLRLPE